MARPERKTPGRLRPDEPTLLIFTLGARRERVRRRLLPGPLGAWELALHRDCLEAALAAGRANGCRLRVSSPQPLRLGDEARQLPQRGRDFGQRLRRAVALQAAAPGRPLVVVGSDVPGLTARHVGAALAGLRDDPGRLVVGPSPDGGFYLLAAAQPLDDLLAEVAWQRPDTLDSLLQAAQARGLAVELLTPLSDLDRAADLARWLRQRGPGPAWRRRLLALLRRLCRPLPALAQRPPRPCRVAAPSERGPPA